MNRKPQKDTGEIEEDADYVNTAVCREDENVTSYKKFGSFTQSFLPLAVSWVILLVILSLHIYFTSVISETNAELTAQNHELKTSQLAVCHNLTDLNHKLTSRIQNLTRNHNTLTVQFKTLTQSFTVLESKNENLTTENDNLTKQNQDLRKQNQKLKTDVNDLNEKIQAWTELNVSRAQWSIDRYCKYNEDKCQPCQRGWGTFQSSCYAINNAEPSGQKTWAEAQTNCKEINSDLVVVMNEVEKEYIDTHSWAGTGIRGYWIGLRAEDGKWKWVDGSELTENSWIQQHLPTDGYCVISVPKQGWRTVNCGDKNAWICQQKALSV